MDKNALVMFLAGPIPTAIANALAVLGGGYWLFRNWKTLISNFTYLIKNGPRRFAVRMHKSDFQVAKQLYKDNVLLNSYNSMYMSDSFVQIILYIFTVLNVGFLMLSFEFHLSINEMFTMLTGSIVDRVEVRKDNRVFFEIARDILQFSKDTKPKFFLDYRLPILVVSASTIIILGEHFKNRRIMRKVYRLRRRRIFSNLSVEANNA
ncbi:MAG: hypothetical protein KGQ52_05295 [Alphaproteobacteria bacterium]|nr:hypothetical protein [Alphaproteobacteria bacterium]